MRKCLYKLLILILLILVSDNREMQKQFTMQQLKQADGWLYIDKMVLADGEIQVKLATERVQGQSKMLVSDQNWQNYRQKKCTIDLTKYQLKIKHELFLSKHLSISQRIIDIKNQQLYYFILLDCDNKLAQQHPNKQLKIKLTLQIINNGRYMGQQQDHWLIIPIIIIISVWIIYMDKQFLKKQHLNDLDYAKLIVFCAILSDIISLIWKSFGYVLYRNIGSNYLLFHLIYLFLHAFSETMTLCLLILISMGWSLNFLTGPKFDIALPILSFLIIINIILTLMTQVSNSSHDIHHTFDVKSGTVLIIIRILIGIIFVIFTIKTYNQSSRYRVRIFIKKFMIYGLLYIYSMPLIIWCANRFIQKKQRNEFVFIANQAIKNICNICLIYMVSSSRSQYKKLSYRNVGMLKNQQIGIFQF